MKDKDIFYKIYYQHQPLADRPHSYGLSPQDAPEILLKHKDYDGHSYEAIELATKRANEIITNLEKLKSKP